jgi:pectin methylesterase-like acyl-CoA thioesterase
VFRQSLPFPTEVKRLLVMPPAVNRIFPGAAVFMAILASSSLARAELKLIERWPTDEKVCIDAPLRLTFDQPPTLGSAGKIEVCRVADGVAVETIALEARQFTDTFGAIGGPVLRYDPVRIDGPTASIRLRSQSLKYGEAYFVRIGQGVFADFPGVTEGWQFTTKPALPRNPERLTVAAGGSADFCTVQGAVDQIDPHRTQPAIITIRSGRYEELIRISREKRFIHLVGEDRKGTVIACTNNDKLNPGWIHRSVIGVEGDDFSIENLTVRNTTPYKGSQAEAICLNAERCVLKNADFYSFQDTLHLSGSVKVSDCYIEGDVDYIWGYGSAFFERCELKSLHDGYIVQARNPAGKAGYVFLNCKLTATPEVKKCWLARIERERFPASHVAFIGCQMGPHIPAAGWLTTGPESAALRFEEFKSTDPAGQPVDVSQRNPASKQISEKEAAELSDAAKVLSSNHPERNPN